MSRAAMQDAEADGIVMFSPLPPRPNGIGDYCFELLAELSRSASCTVVVEDGTEAATAPPGVMILREAEYRARRLQHRLHVYQVGNNPDHVYMLPHIARVPGLVVLHDPSLHYLLHCATVEVGDTAQYAAALATEYGAAGRLLGTQFAAHGLREEAMFQTLPMTAGMLGAARGVIVHSRFAASLALARAPAAAVTIVPHHFSPPLVGAGRSRVQVRRELDIEADEVMFVSLGFVTRAKQVDRALRALAARRGELPPFRYVIAGELRPDEVDLEALAAELGVRDRLVLPGYVPESAFFDLARAADVVINLRHPIGGETSGTMIRALGCGACVVVVDRGPFAEIPDGAAVKLAWNGMFQQRLGDALVQLAGDAAARRAIGGAAEAYIAASHGLDRSVALYRRAISAARTCPAPRLASRVAWRAPAPVDYFPLRAAARAALGPDGRLPRWFLAAAVPFAAPAARVAVVGATPSDLALLEVLGYAAPDRLAVSALADLPPRAFDLLVVFAEGAPDDIAAANAALAFGGRLVVAVGAEAAGAGAAPRGQVAGRLRAYGFRVDLGCTDTPTCLAQQDLDDGDLDGGACWLAVKLTEFGVGSTALADAAGAVMSALRAAA